MSYINKTVSLNCTEKEFIKAFINELTNAESRIICETDIDTEFENEDTSHKPTIILNVNNCYKLKLVRDYVINDTGFKYNICRVVNDIEYDSTDLRFSENYAYISAVVTRTLKFTIISNENLINIRFCSYDTDLKDYVFSAISYHEDKFNIAAYNISKEFVRTDENSLAESYKVANRLLYTRSDEDVEIIESKVLMQNDIAVHDMKNVYDCSNIIAGNILSFDNNRYFSIDTNTLIKI